MDDDKQVPPRASLGLYVRSQKRLALRDHRVRMMSRRLKKRLPWVQDGDFPLLRAWCEIEILSTRIYQELRTRKTLIADGENVAVIRLVEDYRKLRTAQMPFTNALGMSPASRRSLKGKALDDASGFDLVSAFAQAGEPDEAVEVAQLVRNSTPDDAAKTPAPVEEPEPGVTLVDDAVF